MKKSAFFAALVLVLMALSPLSAATLYETGDGDSAWGGDVQVGISNISAPPWAPNGTTSAGAIWVNKVDSGFQGGGPALGVLTIYTLTLLDVVSFHARALADDGSLIEKSVDGGAFSTLVNSSGAPQGVNCSSLVPSCPATMVWDSGMVAVNGGLGGDVILRFTTSQDVGGTPMGLQASVMAESVPEPSTLALMTVGAFLVGLGWIKKRV
ncbi:MAG: PEP-CTERM sorting domain-containing protein [Candidatus Moranbacteria bacterium]|nr:PEP-CTERM sorting domain-containing protein [Candidatus Moranbacteria bacterium]